MSNTNNDAAPKVKWTRLFYIVFILGIIGVAVQDFPRNIAELTQIGLSLSWGLALAILLSLFRIFQYLAVPLFLYYLFIDLLSRMIEEGQILVLMRVLLSNLKKN